MEHSKELGEASIGNVKDKVFLGTIDASKRESVWKPGKQEFLIMASLVSLMISLDATIVITSLSVRLEYYA